MEHLNYMVNLLSALTSIPIRVLDGTGRLVYTNNQGKKNGDPFLKDRELLNCYLENCKKKSFPFIGLEEECFFYGAYSISQAEEKKDDNIYLWGPFTEKPLSKKELDAYKIRHHIDLETDFSIGQSSLKNFSIVLALFFEKVSQTALPPETLLEKNGFCFGEKAASEKKGAENQQSRKEKKQAHHIYADEIEMVNAIRKGDMEGARKTFEKPIVRYTGRLSSDTLKHYENLVICFITISTRAAIDGGLSPSIAYAVSDLYIQKLEDCNQIPDILSVMKLAVVEFAKRVKQEKEKKNDSKYVEMCKDFIANNLNDKFHLEDMANYVGINKAYLSHHFTVHTGMTLHQYLHRERIRAACNMLKYSDASIPDIANYLCFSSQSHFGTVFKKYMGESPQQYREQNKTIEYR